MSETVAELGARLLEEHDLRRLRLVEYPSIDAIAVDVIQVREGERGEGRGTAAMRDLIEWADANAKVIYLTPDDTLGSSQSQLRRWYKRLGFKRRPSGHGDFQVRYLLMREPIGSSVSNPQKPLDARDGLVLLPYYQRNGVAVRVYRDDAYDDVIGYYDGVGGVSALWGAPATKRSFERNDQIWPEELTGGPWDGADRLIVGRSKLDPEYQGRGLGVWMYEKMLDVAQDTDSRGRPYDGPHKHGPIIFMAEASSLGSGTSFAAERVWDALARRYPSVDCGFERRSGFRRCPPMILSGA